MKRKWTFIVFAAVLSTVMAFGMAGCSSNPGGYLNGKYSTSFTSTNENTESDTGIFHYSDSEGNTVEVKQEDGKWADNYYSVIYDDEITQKLTGLFDFNYRVEVSSSFTYVDQDQKYNSVDEYLASSPSIAIIFYSNASPDQTETVQKLSEALGGNCPLSVQFRSVPAEEVVAAE